MKNVIMILCATLLSVPAFAYSAADAARDNPEVIRPTTAATAAQVPPKASDDCHCDHASEPSVADATTMHADGVAQASTTKSAVGTKSKQ